MAHVIPFRLPEPAKTQKREPIAAGETSAKVTYLGALKRQKQIRVAED